MVWREAVACSPACICLFGTSLTRPFSMHTGPPHSTPVPSHTSHSPTPASSSLRALKDVYLMAKIVLTLYLTYPACRGARMLYQACVDPEEWARRRVRMGGVGVEGWCGSVGCLSDLMCIHTASGPGGKGEGAGHGSRAG